MLLPEHLPAIKRVCVARVPGSLSPSPALPLTFSQRPHWCSRTHSCVHAFSLLHMSPPPSRVHYLTRYFDNLQIIEDSSKEGCKNGYLRHTDSSILDHGGAHRPGRPGDPSPEEGELVNLLAPFFNEKAALLLGAR